MSSGAVQQRYRIGTVTRLTGINAVTLRMWERRYAIVLPDRSEGRNRLYSHQDITRLALIKRLVDQGHAIGTLAGLSDDALRLRLRELEPVESSDQSSSSAFRLAVIGEVLSVQAEAFPWQKYGVELCGCHADRADWVAQGKGLCDAVMVECLVLDEAQAAQLQQHPALAHVERILVLYGVAHRRALRRLEKHGIICLRGPLDPAQCLLALGRGTAPSTPMKPSTMSQAHDEIPAQRFDPVALAQISRLPSVVECECPRHLSDLLFSLNAFEAYCLECQHRNAEDAVMHAYLHHSAAQARQILETALARLLEFEGLQHN